MLYGFLDTTRKGGKERATGEAVTLGSEHALLTCDSDYGCASSQVSEPSSVGESVAETKVVPRHFRIQTSSETVRHNLELELST